MSWLARDSIRGWQRGRETAQEVLRTWLRAAGERAVWKKETLFCSMREMGRQRWKVLLARKVVKKVGQEAEVKFVPRDESKGDGRGGRSVVGEVVEVVVDDEEDVVGVADSDVEVVRVDIADEVSAEVVAATADIVDARLITDEVLLAVSLSCRLSRRPPGLGGGSLLSYWICPRLASLLNKGVSYGFASSMPSAATTDSSESRINMPATSRKCTFAPGRRRPGLGL